ncbi:MAG: lipoate--protein ligase family protein [Isosphaeraceae bacterium]
MTRPLCRLFPDEAADGPTNMARDEALLELVLEDPRGAVFRTYGWTEPTLSLGYFQSVQRLDEDPRWRGVPVVRRPTGGGAIWHDREVTYALAVPSGHPLSGRGSGLYHALHEALLEWFRELGIPAFRHGPLAPGETTIPRPFLCFSDRSPEDIVVGPVKLVGSAQRRRSGAILQHGSVLLSRATLTPELPGLQDVAPGSIDSLTFSDRLRERVLESLGFQVRSEGYPDGWLERITRIATKVYRDPKWTGRS